MSRARKNVASIFKMLGDSMESVSSSTEFYLLWLLADDELKSNVFGLIGMLAAINFGAKTVATWAGRPSNTAQDVATNAFDTAVGATITGMLGSAVFKPFMGVPNQFMYATALGLIYLGMKHGAVFGGMSADQFEKSFSEMKKNKLLSTAKLIDAVAPFVKGMGLVALLSHDKIVGESLEDAANQQIQPVDQRLARIIAVACAEQALSKFKDVVLEAYNLYKNNTQLQEHLLAKAEIQRPAENSLQDPSAEYHPLAGHDENLALPKSGSSFFVPSPAGEFSKDPKKTDATKVAEKDKTTSKPSTPRLGGGGEDEV